MSAESYLRNLNTHRAYREFRKMRDSFRDDDKAIDSIAIAGTLLRYSEKGSEYVNLLRHIIEKNDLRTLDDAQLGDSILEIRPDV
jgi:Bax protein